MVACYSDTDPLRYPNPIRICIRCGADTLVIRRPTHKMIQRSEPVHAVKTRRRFGPKIVSFYVNICSCVIFLFTIVNGYLYFTRIISCERLVHFTCIIMHIIF